MEQDSKIPPEDHPEKSSLDSAENVSDEVSTGDQPLETNEGLVVDGGNDEEAIEAASQTDLEPTEDLPIESLADAVEESVSEITDAVFEPPSSEDEPVENPDVESRDPDEGFQESVASLLNSVGEQDESVTDEVGENETLESVQEEIVIPADPKLDEVTEDELAEMIGEAFDEDDKELGTPETVEGSIVEDSEAESASDGVAETALEEEVLEVADPESEGEEAPAEPSAEMDSPKEIEDTPEKEAAGENSGPIESKTEDETLVANVAEDPRSEDPALDEAVDSLVGEAFGEEDEPEENETTESPLEEAETIEAVEAAKNETLESKQEEIAIPVDSKLDEVSDADIADVVEEAFDEDDKELGTPETVEGSIVEDSEAESASDGVAETALEEEVLEVADPESEGEEAPAEPSAEMDSPKEIEDTPEKEAAGENSGPIESKTEDETLVANVAEDPRSEDPALDEAVDSLVGEAFGEEGEPEENETTESLLEDTETIEPVEEAVNEPVAVKDTLETGTGMDEEGSPEIPDSSQGIEEIAGSEEAPELEENSAESVPVPIEVPELQILDDDEIEEEEDKLTGVEAQPEAIAEDTTRETEATDAAESVDDVNDGATDPLPSADDLIKKAGGILDGNALAEDPASPEIGLVEVEEEDEEELMAMPDPQALMDNAADDEEDTEAKTEIAGSGNVADRGGDLPPPPPAPVSIDDDEEEAVSDEVVTPEASTNPQILVIDEEEAANDPFASNDLDGFNSNLDDIEAAEGEEKSSIFDDIEDEVEGETNADSPEEKSAVAKIEPPPPSKFKRWINITSMAAALALMGIGLSANAFKNEIYEWIKGRDLDGSELTTQVAILSKHALERLNEDGMYRMKWIESSIKEASKNEIRMFARVGAQLERDLYLPVLDEYVYRQLSYSEDEFQDAMQYLVQNEKSDELSVPEKPWTRLYRRSASRDEVVNLRVSYRFTREKVDDEWKLTDIRVRGEDEKFVWPEGEPIEAYGKNAYDVASPEFKDMILEYEEVSKTFLGNVNTLKELEYGKAAELARLREEKRNQLIGAMSRGAFYKGMVISGEDASDAREVTMIITETRNEGSLIKGVIKLSEKGEIAKHFTGDLKIEERGEDEIRGMLNLVTLAFEGEKSGQGLPPFFNPGTVMRLRLKTDGFQVEGDSRDLSMRLVRTM